MGKEDPSRDLKNNKVLGQTDREREREKERDNGLCDLGRRKWQQNMLLYGQVKKKRETEPCNLYASRCTNTQTETFTMSALGKMFNTSPTLHIQSLLPFFLSSTCSFEALPLSYFRLQQLPSNTANIQPLLPYPPAHS